SRGCLLVLESFFFQAEDGIRARNVTGVQTCALPIYPGACRWAWPVEIPVLRLKIRTLTELPGQQGPRVTFHPSSRFAIIGTLAGRGPHKYGAGFGRVQ